jgi:hypothetical protein
MVSHYLVVTITVEIIVVLNLPIMGYLMILLQFVLSYLLDFNAGEAHTVTGSFTCMLSFVGSWFLP